MKIWDIIKEDFNGKQKLDEGWRENVLATIMSVASFFGSVKGQNIPSDGANISVSQQVSDSSLRLDIGKIFKSGRYQFDKKDDKIFKNELRKFGEEIQRNPTSDFNVQIVSSESRVTNYDMEQSSPTYGKPLKEKELAQKRAQTVNFILTNFANQLKKEGVLKGNVNIVEPQILLGDVPWPSVDPKTGVRRSNDDSVYTKDQFVIVNIKISKTPIVTPEQKPDKFAIYGNMGEDIYANGRLWAEIFYPVRKSNDVTKSGNVDAGYQDVLLKTVKPDVKILGKKDEQGVYLKSYVIPWAWWNKETGTTHSLTPSIVNYIETHFEVNQ